MTLLNNYNYIQNIKRHSLTFKQYILKIIQTILQTETMNEDKLNLVVYRELKNSKY